MSIIITSLLDGYILETFLPGGKAKTHIQKVYIFLHDPKIMFHNCQIPPDHSRVSLYPSLPHASILWLIVWLTRDFQNLRSSRILENDSHFPDVRARRASPQWDVSSPKRPDIELQDFTCTPTVHFLNWYWLTSKLKKIKRKDMFTSL